MSRIQLTNQSVEVVDCKKCGHKMVNIDADQLERGDLLTLKRAGVRISNPETEDPICLECEVDFKKKLSSWFDSEDDDDDSSFFSSGGIFGGSSTFGGFGSGGGSFGGFGGGGFSGGGASRGF